MVARRRQLQSLVAEHDETRAAPRVSGVTSSLWHSC